MKAIEKKMTIHRAAWEQNPTLQFELSNPMQKILIAGCASVLNHLVEEWLKGEKDMGIPHVRDCFLKADTEVGEIKNLVNLALNREKLSHTHIEMHLRVIEQKFDELRRCF